MAESLRQLLADRILRQQVLRRAGLWTLVVAVFIGSGVYFSRAESREIALGRARESLQKDTAAHPLWIAQRRGVYMPLDEGAQAGSRSTGQASRTVTDATGRVFAWVNPAQDLRGQGSPGFGLEGRILGFGPGRPEHAPDAWEQKALARIRSGARECWEEVALAGTPRLRFMGALIATESCLPCHQSQGWKPGEVAGGVSFTVPLLPGPSLLGGVHNLIVTLGLGMLWVLGLGVILTAGRWNLRQARLEREAEEERRGTEANFRRLFQANPHPMWVYDRETLRFLAVNDAAVARYGYSEREFLAMTIKDIRPSQDVGRLETFIGGLPHEGIRASDEWKHLKKDGSILDVEIISHEHTFGGRPARVVLANDITDRKRAEREKANLQAQLVQAQKMESLGCLAGGVAHDMNNVLGAILGLASAHIETLPVGSPTHRILGTIIKASERGGRMVKSLLNFARQSPAEERELDLNAILREEVRLLGQTTLAGARLEMDLAEDLMPIRGDESALTHAFMNLFVNAVDAMPQAGVLALRTRNVDEGWIEAVVEDTGTGMAPEVLAKALDPFFTTKEVGKGTGLGLSMAYSAVKAHRGHMEIQSEPGCGTRVKMRFPACRRVERPQERQAEPDPGSAPRRLEVLLVDDDELVLSSTKAILEVLGHLVTVAPSGEEALAKVQAGYHPDVVILDLTVPGLGGAETLQRLRTLHPGLPVFLATGRADQTAIDLTAAHPHVTLLPKPFGLKDLEQCLEGLVPAAPPTGPRSPAGPSQA